MATKRWVALLRGINVGGNKKVPMAQLRELVAELEWTEVATYIQSGNVIFAAKGKPATLEDELEQALQAHFGFTVPVLVRSADEWLGYAKGSAFPAAESERPNLLHLALSKSPPKTDAKKALQQYCKAGEQVVVRGDAIWIDFVEGVGSSKLTPAVLDRVFGSTVTARNWKSVQAIAGLLGQG
ncbi:MAG: DUF1697 domain-containing protein [Planctomycetes bacterium]|nr:DUF1697 domain-containing protein [Planctomycetota bacterium]